jgi:hypothetical protein
MQDLWVGLMLAVMEKLVSHCAVANLATMQLPFDYSQVAELLRDRSLTMNLLKVRLS